MQLYKFFDLKTPSDLLHKLEREYDRWKADELNVDLAWNFFVTAEHVADWVYYQDMPTSMKTRADLLDNEKPSDFKMNPSRPLLRICSHLANGGKHFHLGNCKLTSVASTRKRGAGTFAARTFAARTFASGVFARPALVVDLVPGEQQALSLAEASIKALNLAADLLAFWQARVP
jgi:hypothetical protein